LFPDLTIWLGIRKTIEAITQNAAGA